MPRGCVGERRRKENLALKRIILVLLMVAMTLGVTGTAMAQAQAPSAEQLLAQMSEPLPNGCTLWFGSLVTCV
jgi:hypothetical protein